jgi:hypothetical protein
MHKTITLLLALVCFCSSSNAENTTPKNINDTLYLSSDTFAGLELLAPFVNNYDVFITGENHTYLKSNAKLWTKMIKYLNKTAGLQSVMIEYGYSSGWLINKYIQTGDTALYNVLKSYSFKELAYAYKDMMEYNKTLPEGKKLYFTGIDLERGIYSASKVLGLLLPKDKDVPDSLELHIESLQSLITYNDNIIASNKEDFTDYFQSYSSNTTIDKIIANFNAHNLLYQAYLGVNFEEFKKVIKGLEDVKVWNQYEEENATHQFVYREKYLYGRFLEEYKLKGGKFFGQFGRCHSATSIQEANSCNWYNFKSLAHRIQSSKDVNLKDKVFSIGIMYDESYADEGWKNLQDHIDSIFGLLADNCIMLYDLKSDTLMNNKLSDMFNLLFFNKFEPSQNYIYGRDDDDDDGDGDYTPINSKDKKFFSLNGGLYGFNFNELNKWFDPLKKDAFNGNMTFIGFSIVNSSDKLAQAFSMNFFINQKNKFNDSMSSKFGGLAIHSQSGYNITRKSKHISIIPAWGLGFSNLTLEMIETTNNANPLSGFLGEDKLVTYYNPGITTDFSLNIEAKIKKISLGLWGGYQFDLSNKHWFAKERLKKGPETSLRAWYAGLQLAIHFD